MHFWAGKYPGKVGWLVGPSSGRKKPRRWLPWALDNDAYTAWDKGHAWNEDTYFQFLEWAAAQEQQPLWAAVPDVVANRDKTHRNWEKYASKVKQYGWPLAFVAQDGMEPGDVPEDASVVFIGGTYRWKWRNVPEFSAKLSRVHVGRVNTLFRLRRCEELGVESVDGTGWFRRPEAEFIELEDFLAGIPDPQMTWL